MYPGGPLLPGPDDPPGLSDLEQIKPPSLANAEAYLKLARLEKTAVKMDAELAELERAVNEAAKQEQAKLFTAEERVANAEADLAEELVEIIRQDRSERKNYANKLYSLLACWLASVFLIIGLTGFKEVELDIDTPAIPHMERLLFKSSFELSENIILAMIGGTTVNVIGLFVIVAKYLFKPQNRESLKPQEKDR